MKAERKKKQRIKNNNNKKTNMCATFESSTSYDHWFKIFQEKNVQFLTPCKRISAASFGLRPLSIPLS